MKTPRNAGLTWIEAIVLISVVAVLAALAMPAVTVKGGPGQMTQTLSNMKQLCMATRQMAIDGVMNGKANLGWPGDNDGTFSNWTTQLLNGYLQTNDLCKLLSAPGKIVPTGKIPPMHDTALLVYAVSEESLSNAVFLTTANFTNTPAGGLPLEASAKPYGNKGFIVFRKAGDGMVLLPKQVGQTNIIGSYVPLCR